MTVSELVKKAELTVFAGSNGLNNEIVGGYTSDLLSDVMGNADAGCVWITLQSHKNVMAIASLKELAAVIIVNSGSPEADMSEQAEKEGIPVLGTTLGAFEISGILYNSLNA
jgi:predicted transcriptional regulator